jgi:hypothetical protein
MDVPTELLSSGEGVPLAMASLLLSPFRCGSPDLSVTFLGLGDRFRDLTLLHVLYELAASTPTDPADVELVARCFEARGPPDRRAAQAKT